MADNTTTTTARKPAKRRSTARRSTATRRTSAGTAAKSPSAATARRQRTIARNETRDAAQAQVKAATTTAAQGRNVAERAALVYVGATLEARDRVVGMATGLVDRYGSRASAEKEVRKLERRGNTARNQLERDVRKARTRLERQVRTRRRDAERILRRNRRAVEREVATAERQAARRPNIVAARIGNVSGRVEDAAQFGVATSTRIATAAKERVSALV